MSGNDRDAMLAYLERLRSMIAQHGWAVQGVMHPTGLGGQLGVFYTVGLTERGLPELTLSGGDPEECKGLLNLIGARALDGALEPDQLYQVDRVPPFVVEDLPLDQARRRLVMAVNLYGPRFTAAQRVKFRLRGTDG